MVFKTLPSFPKGKKCQLCLTAKVDPEALGNICQTADVIVHYFCLLLASKIQQKGTDKQGLLGFFSRDIKKEIKRGSTIVCNYCKKNGATVMCCRDSCHLNFHVPCAQQNGSLHQYFNEFKSFCDKHKPRQKIPATLKKKRDLECVLCFSPIKFNVKSHEVDPIWPTCCKPQALLHKRCLQHFATSSGYYFKCPYCSNKEEFYKGMKNFGIYIPEQEASWETEPNAYRELLERDISCDAGMCRCPRGPVYSVRNSKWYLEVCVLCGTNGRHRGCMLTNIITDTYECDVCAKVNPKNYLNSIPDDIDKPSPLSEQGECNEAVQQSIEGNISKSLSVECGEIIEISDSESEMQHGDDISPNSVTKNDRKRRLSVRQGKRSGLKRQRLAESGAETSSQMRSIDDKSWSSLPQVKDNAPLRTEKITNNPQTSEANVPNEESTSSIKDHIRIAAVCTLAQNEFDSIFSDSPDTNEVCKNQKPVVYIDLISDNETNEVFVIPDTDTESNASSLLDSDSSLLDLSEIPESEKSLLFDNFSQPNNYASGFPKRPQTKKKRRKKKKQTTPRKKKPSINATQNVLHVSNTMDDETFSNKNINTSSNQRNLESTTSSVVADANNPLISPLENCNSSEEETFKGFPSEEAQSNNETVRVSTPILAEGAIQAKKICTNEEKNVNSTQHMSGKHIFLSSVDDINKSFILDNLNLINKVNSSTCQVNDLNENTQPNFTDDSTIIKNKNSVVLKKVVKDDTNHDKSVSDKYELSNCKSNTVILTNVTINSLQELSLNENGIDAVICNTNPSELSRKITNTNQSKFNLDKEEVAEVLHEAVDVDTSVNKVFIKESIPEKESKTTCKTKTIPVVEDTNKSEYIFEAKEPNSKKPKIICSLELKQSFSEIIDSFYKNDEEEPHKSKLHNDTSSKKDILTVCNDHLKVSHKDQFSLSEITSNKSCSKILGIPIGQIPNVNPNAPEDSVSPENSRLQFELHSPKGNKEVLQETHFSEPDRKSESSMHSVHLSTMSQSSERVRDLTVLESKSILGISKHQPLLENSIGIDPFNLHSSKYLDLESSQPQFGKPLSKIAPEAPLKSNPSKNIPEIAPVASSGSYPTQIDLQPSVSSSSSTEAASSPNLESKVFIEHSESHQNSLLEKHCDTSSSSIMIKSRKSECKLEVQIEVESSSKSEIDSVSSELNSGSSNFLENKAYLNLTKTNENKNVFHSSVGSLFQDLGSCKLEPMKSEVPESCKLEPMKSEVQESCKLELMKSEVSESCKLAPMKPEVPKSCKLEPTKSESSKLEPTKSESSKLEPMKSGGSKNPSKLTPNIKTYKSRKNKDNKVKSEYKSKNTSCFQMKLKYSKTNNNKTKKELSCIIKEREQAKPKHEVKLSEVILSPVHKVLLSSDPNLPQEQLFTKTHEVEKQMSSEDSKIRLNPTISQDLHQQNQSEMFFVTEENKRSNKIVNSLDNTNDSTTLEGERTNHDHENIQNEIDGDNVSCTSRDSGPTKHDWYKICATDCSTCHNSVSLIAKYNMGSNDEIDICFYCKNKINNTPLEILNSQVPSTCSCQESKNNSEVFDDSKLSKDNSSLIRSDSNSNYESDKSLEKRNTPFKDGLNIVCKEINTLDAESSLNLSHGGENMTTELEPYSSIHDNPSSIENSSVISGNRNPETKIKLGVDVNNDNSTEVLNSGTLQQSSDEIKKGDFEKKTHESRRYFDKVFKVRIILKKINNNNNNKPSLMSHIETFWLNKRKYFRELLKARYFSENDQNLVVYTDVCGFRYVRLFIENIPKTVDTKVVFESGSDIVSYLQKLITHQETVKIVSLQTVLIVYGNTLLPEENVFHLLELASNLNNIKLVITTFPSQNPRIMKFNRKLIYFSKKIGYHVWDITKIHFQTDSFER